MTRQAGRFANIPDWRWTDNPPGYALRWADQDRPFDLLIRQAWMAYGPPWLVRCNAHNTTHQAQSTAEADQLGTREGRLTWCEQCIKEAAVTDGRQPVRPRR